jgi:hypothetical protein
MARSASLDRLGVAGRRGYPGVMDWRISPFHRQLYGFYVLVGMILIPAVIFSGYLVRLNPR